MSGGALDQALRRELIARAERDQALLQSLKDRGELPDDAYHPRLRRLHQANTAWAKEIIRRDGWPGVSQVGEDGSDAMWLIVQHSVLDPAFMLSCVSQLEQLVRQGEASGWQLAFLQDRALMLQHRPQIYGTQHVLDAAGVLQPYDLADADRVDQRRRWVGLGPLAERTRRLRSDHQRLQRARQQKHRRS